MHNLACVLQHFNLIGTSCSYWYSLCLIALQLQDRGKWLSLVLVCLQADEVFRDVRFLPTPISFSGKRDDPLHPNWWVSHIMTVSWVMRRWHNGTTTWHKENIARNVKTAIPVPELHANHSHNSIWTQDFLGFLAKRWSPATETDYFHIVTWSW